MDEEPIYVSKAGWRSFGNAYRIYRDRIELGCWFCFHTFVISYGSLVSIDLFRPPVIRTKLWALKLDLADIFGHVGIERTTGFMKFIRFTPDDPAEFVRLVKEYSKV